MIESGVYAALAYAGGRPSCRALFKTQATDFRVEEDLGFELSGSGEHFCMQITKTGLTTRQVLERVTRWAGVAESAIGYAGQKDKQGVCTQWFSIGLAGKVAPDMQLLNQADLQVEQAVWNSRKIRLGSHRANRFCIRLRAVNDPQQELPERLYRIERDGVPNYFGEQRFGNHESNLQQVAAWFAGQGTGQGTGQSKPPRRHQRSMLLSAARAAVFNEVLSRRVDAGNWNTWLDGDVLNLSGSDSVFVPDIWDQELEQRLLLKDLHPTGPLWGQGELRSQQATRELELAVREQLNTLCTGLEARGLRQERRSLRVMPGDWQVQHSESSELQLSFSLPPGCYATAVLREVCQYQSGPEWP